MAKGKVKGSGTKLDPPALIVQVGKTEVRYQLRGLDDLQKMLKQHGDWYGLKKGLRGRFGMYVSPVMEAMGLAEVEYLPKNNRMRSR
jgi:hypothetical protein